MIKEFYLLNSLDATPEIFIKEGYNVISFAQVKKEILKILPTKKSAENFHSFNRIIDKGNKEMETIADRLNGIVFKEARGGGNRIVIGWETAETYLRYHSGIFYKWYN
jgi:hypothetical protein